MKSRYALALARSVERSIASCALDLRGLTVATEAATGAYAVTAAAAAAAGARVWAYAHDSDWGSAEQSVDDVGAVLHAVACPSVEVRWLYDRSGLPTSSVDIMTNSGHLRPLNRAMMTTLKPGGAIALMYEAWELRTGDIDLACAMELGVPIFGVNERHQACGAFEYVGLLVLSEAMRQGWSVTGARIAIISDNDFLGPIERTLTSIGAHVLTVDLGREAHHMPVAELAVIATTPKAVATLHDAVSLSAERAAQLAVATGCYGCIHLWGDVERRRLQSHGVMVAPAKAPAPGHQAITMGAAGFEPVVRLQVAGLAAAHYGRLMAKAKLSNAPPAVPDSLAGLVQPVRAGIR